MTIPSPDTYGERERHRLVLGLGLACLAALLAMFSNQMLVFAWSVSLALTLSLALGVMQQGKLGPFRWPLAAALAVWLLALTLMQVLPRGPERLVLGFTPAVAAGVYLLWLLPLVLVTLPYALHFDRFVLTPAAYEGFAARQRHRDES